MKAARIHGLHDLRLDEVEIPKVEKGSIRIKVKACAICGSDLRILNVGDFRVTYPVIPGHEIAGIVDKVGDCVEDFKVSDRVTIAPGFACGRCRNCVKGRPNICLNPYNHVGYTLNGGFAEYMSVPAHLYREGFINKIPDGLSFEEASMTEIIACSLNAHEKINIKTGDSVLILGAGPAGIIHSHISRYLGATMITLAQRGKYRLEQAKKLFADVIDDTVCISEVDLESYYLKKNDNRAPDKVIVCAPSRDAQELASRIVAPGGCINFFGGLPSSDPFIRINSNDLHYKEYIITGSSSSKPLDNINALQLLSRKMIDGNKLITHEFKLRDISEAFKCAEEKHCLKVVIKP